jgi:hypothetical protein
MNIRIALAKPIRLAALLAAQAALVIAAGCSDAGHPRGMFSGYVMDKTEEEVTDKIGKPLTVEKSSADQARWVYKRKTFDPDNSNKPDDETHLVFKREAASGKLKVTEVEFR